MLIGRFGSYGGRFVPETLMFALDELSRVYEEAANDPVFQAEFKRLLHDFVIRPNRLYYAERLTQHAGARIFLAWRRLGPTGIQDQ